MGSQAEVVIFNTPGRPADDEIILKAAIAFANGAELILERSGDRKAHATDDDRGEFLRLLAAAVVDRAAVLWEFQPIAVRLFSELKIQWTFTVNVRHGLQRGYFLDFTTPRAMLDYAIALVLDGSHPVGSMVARCKLPRCRRFYIARRNRKGGPAPLVYCKPAHRKEHHDSSDRRLGKV